MYRIDPPKEVADIIDVLTGHGYEAYAVGGCIRDSVMGRQSKDWDITTNACPDTVKGIFERTLDTGLSHGTVTVMMGAAAYEVTTFRIDGLYVDGRHPEHVEFTGRLEDDLKRRDFTINAMAWNAECGIVDPFDGMSDIAARIIRAVGVPVERFREDALRMLRAVRFAARLGFEIEESTFDAIKDNCTLIRKISAERIRDELTGILTSDDPAKFMLLAEAGLLGEILEKLGYSIAIEAKQGFQEGHSVDSAGAGSPQLPEGLITGVNTGSDILKLPNDLCLNAVRFVENDICLRWAMLIHCFAVSMGVVEYAGVNAAKADALYEKFLAKAKDILGKLKFSNKIMDRILCLLKYADMAIQPEQGEVARGVSAVGEDIFSDLLKLKRAAVLAQENRIGCDNSRLIDEIENIYHDLLASGRCLKLKDLAVSGQDLMRIGYHEGKTVGNALSYLLDRVLADPDLNRKEILERIALDYLSESEKQEN